MSEYYHAPIPKNGAYGFFSPLLNVSNKEPSAREITDKNCRVKNKTSFDRATPSITIPLNKTNMQSAASSSMMRIPPRAVSIFLDKIEVCFNVRLQMEDLACPADVLEELEKVCPTKENLSILIPYLDKTQRLTKGQLESLDNDVFWEENIFCKQPTNMRLFTRLGACIDHLHQISWYGIEEIHESIEKNSQSPWIFALKHSLYSLEIVALLARLQNRHPDRPVVILIHRVFSSLPFFGYLRQLGLRVGCDHEVTSAFANKGIVLVFPGGANDMMLGDDRTHYLGKGFLRLAKAHEARVVMVAGQESLDVYRKFPLIPSLGAHFKVGLPLSAIAPNGLLFLGPNFMPHPKPFTFCMQELKLPNTDVEEAHAEALQLINTLINDSKANTENTAFFFNPILIQQIAYYSQLLELLIPFFNDIWENHEQLMDQTTLASIITSTGINVGISNVNSLALSAGILAVSLMKELCPSLAQPFSRSTTLFNCLQLAVILASIYSVLDEQIAHSIFFKLLLGVFFALPAPESFHD